MHSMHQCIANKNMFSCCLKISNQHWKVIKYMQHIKFKLLPSPTVTVGDGSNLNFIRPQVDRFADRYITAGCLKSLSLTTATISRWNATIYRLACLATIWTLPLLRAQCKPQRWLQQWLQLKNLMSKVIQTQTTVRYSTVLCQCNLSDCVYSTQINGIYTWDIDAGG